jgi:hypothetical protein
MSDSDDSRSNQVRWLTEDNSKEASPDESKAPPVQSHPNVTSSSSVSRVCSLHSSPCSISVLCTLGQGPAVPPRNYPRNLAPVTFVPPPPPHDYTALARFLRLLALVLFWGGAASSLTVLFFRVSSLAYALPRIAPSTTHIVTVVFDRPSSSLVFRSSPSVSLCCMNTNSRFTTAFSLQYER